ncbi:MAG: SDR family NAD(P)-dependent oxidoreductase [Pseudomonadota bacterium]
MTSISRPFAVITGASSGIGYNLAKCAAENGYDLLVAADQPLEAAASDFRALGAVVDVLQVELASRAGVDELYRAIGSRHVDALFANAGHGLGKAFLEQDFRQVQHVIDTNITGTIYLLHKVVRDMVLAGSGRVMVTGSIAGFQPGAFQAVYNGTKAFIDSFVAALRNEIKESKVTVTCLMPGPTDTDFFVRADMLDTRVGADDDNKMDPAEVARIGFKAMMDGEADVIAGIKNKMIVAMSRIIPSEVLAEEHRKMAEPGTAEKA